MKRLDNVLKVFENWVGVTGVVKKNSAMYIEMQGVIEDSFREGYLEAMDVVEENNEAKSLLFDSFYRNF